MPANRQPATRNRRSPHAIADAQIAELRAMQDDPAGQQELALRLMDQSKHLQVVQAALGILKTREDPALRPALHAKYDWCNSSRDPGGFIRAGIIETLRPIIRREDLPVLFRGVATYEMQGMYELCAGVRAAALLAFLDLDTGLAAMFGTRLLADPRNSFSEEPALTAAKVLALTDQVPALFAHASFPQGSGAVMGEVLRSLVGLPEDLVPFLIDAHIDSEDEQVLLGLFDLLLTHPARETWRPLVIDFLRETKLDDLFGIVVMQIVANRDDVLIGELREMAGELLPRAKQQAVDHALELT